MKLFFPAYLRFYSSYRSCLHTSVFVLRRPTRWSRSYVSATHIRRAKARSKYTRHIRLQWSGAPLALDTSPRRGPLRRFYSTERRRTRHIVLCALKRTRSFVYDYDRHRRTRYKTQNTVSCVDTFESPIGNLLRPFPQVLGVRARSAAYQRLPLD